MPKRYISKKAIYQLCQEAKIGVSITFPSEATTEKGKRLKLKKAEKIKFRIVVVHGELLPVLDFCFLLTDIRYLIAMDFSSFPN